ncbi:DUF2510 domain-containing protein [Mycobacterium sp. TJFP1]
MTAPLPLAGWYPDPADARKLRYWDGAAWTQQPASTPRLPGSAVDNNAAAGTGKPSALTIARGLCLILLALIFSFIAILMLSDSPASWDVDATELADTIWRIYFGAMLALCVISLILGILSLARPAMHPLYSVIAGVVAIVTGLVGCGLAFVSVSSADAMGTLIGYVGAGFLFAFGSAVTTLLSAIALAGQRRSGSRPASPGPRPVAPSCSPACSPECLPSSISGRSR